MLPHTGVVFGSAAVNKHTLDLSTSAESISEADQ